MPWAVFFATGVDCFAAGAGADFFLFAAGAFLDLRALFGIVGTDP